MEFQSEYKINIIENKTFIDTQIVFPRQNEFSQLEVQNVNKTNEYIFDINRKCARLTRCTYQNRYLKSIVLLRLDLDTKPHKNPDGNIIGGNHLHVFLDGYEDSYAFELDNPFLNKINPKFDLNKFKADNIYDIFSAFAEFCNIKNIPTFEQNIVDLT